MVSSHFFILFYLYSFTLNLNLILFFFYLSIIYDNLLVDMPSNLTKPNHMYLIFIYKEDLMLNNLQWLICHKTQPKQIIYI